MQNAEIISINLLQILLSLVNLLVLYLVLEKFFYKPVKNMLEARRASIESSYAAAEAAQNQAARDKLLYQSKLKTAESKSSELLEVSEKAAREKAERIIAQAKERAQGIIKQAEENTAAELKNAEDMIRTEIIEAGISLAGKLLEREISLDEHRIMINKFLNELDIFKEAG